MLREAFIVLATLITMVSLFSGKTPVRYEAEHLATPPVIDVSVTVPAAPTPVTATSTGCAATKRNHSPTTAEFESAIDTLLQKDSSSDMSI